MHTVVRAYVCVCVCIYVSLRVCLFVSVCVSLSSCVCECVWQSVMRKQLFLDESLIGLLAVVDPE